MLRGPASRSGLTLLRSSTLGRLRRSAGLLRLLDWSRYSCRVGLRLQPTRRSSARLRERWTEGPRAWRLGRQETLSLALDESLDDLRNDPDLRRAIVAAYARMEAALARAGLPRRPAEAPFEYLERALGTLDTSAESVRRLTALFEWAKFSHHEPDPAMRDEAVDALVAVRDELRAPTEEQVPA